MRFKKGIAMLLISVLLVSVVACMETAPSSSMTSNEESGESMVSSEENTTNSTEVSSATSSETVSEQTSSTSVPSLDTQKPIKVLAIGNSFSDDVTNWLGDILTAAGVTDFKLGNLVIGGCSLDTHYQNATEDAPNYELRRYQNGSWRTQTQVKMSEALAEEDWDIVSIQQVSWESGRKASYGSFDGLVAYIKEKVPADCKIYWHMTWAYQQSSTTTLDTQISMYESIVRTVQEVPLQHPDIGGLFPSGTAIQNLRTSYIGDTLTRDGTHLSMTIGRYTAALTWATSIGIDLDKFVWSPDKEIGTHLPAIKEAVKNAVANPFAVTPSTHTEGEAPVDETVPPTPVKPDGKTAEEKLEALGKNPDDYVQLDLKEQVGAFYNSTDGKSDTRSDQANSPQFIATAIFDKIQLPVGSILILEDGYQYRPEGWVALDQNNPYDKRPPNITTATVVVDNAWWGEFNYRAFNISHKSQRGLTADDCKKLVIFVPKA